MRHRLIAKLFCAALWTCCAAVGCSWFTSNDDPPAEANGAAEDVTVPDGTPEELDKLMREAVGEVNRLVTKSTATARLDDDDKLAEQLLTGVKAADKIMAHPKAAAELVDDALKAKLALLYLGAQKNRPRFENQFGEFVEELLEKDAASPVAAIGSAALIEVKHIAADASPETVFPLLADYAEKYPDRKEGILLFENYADSLARRGQRDAALRCCRLGIEYYKNHSVVGRLRLKIKQIKRMPPDPN